MAEHRLLYKNSTIAFATSGKGRAVVFLHGFLENKSMWQGFVEEFSEKYRIITIDLLGHGQSDCLSYQHSMEENAEVVKAVLESLRIRRVVLIGHSMGGYVALALATAQPQMIKGLVLLNSTALADSLDRKVNRDRAIKAVKKDYGTFIKLAIANLFGAETKLEFLEAIENVKNEALKTPLQGIIAALEGMKIREDRQLVWQNASFAKMLVLGKNDSVLPYQETKVQLEDTDVELVNFSGGHMSHIENYEELVLVLIRFLKRC